MCTRQDKSTHRNESFAYLCETAQLVASALDGASERAVLVADDGTLLYMNPAGAFCNYFYYDFSIDFV